MPNGRQRRGTRGGLGGGVLALAVLAWAPGARAQDSVEPGAVTAPHPTLENLSLEWAFAGDANGDSSVSVRYRAVGETTYREGAPLFRVPAGENAGFSWPDRHAGSVFGLVPGTSYEIELTLTDPDGGGAVETLTVATRPTPAAAADASVVAVTPSTIGDALATASAGDVLSLTSGTYAPLVVEVDGTAARPLVLRAAEPLGAVIEGDVRLDGRAFVHLQGLEVHGQIKLNDSEGIVIRDGVIRAEENGIVAYGSGTRDTWITGNVVTGPTLYTEGSLGVSGDNLGEGIQLTGPGNVIAFNRVSGFRDCVSLLEEDEAVEQTSIDIYGNDLEGCADDGIEADYAMGNVRVYQNRIRRSFMGISAQPSLGGPTYFVRNVLFGVLYEAFKLHNGSNGDVGYHNTVIKTGDAFGVYTDDPISRATFRNNLFLGAPGAVYGGYDTGAGAVLSLRPADASCSFDYDGLGSIGTGEFTGRIGDTRFSDLAELQASTTEAHAVEVDLGVFSAQVALPDDPFAPVEVPSLELASGSAAVDRGVVLPNLNDGFSGEAPDLGAYELGAPEPSYGPGGELGPPPAAGSGSGSGGTTGSPPVTEGGDAAEPGADAGAGTAPATASEDDGGCGCATAGSRTGRGRWAFAAALLPLLAAGRRRRPARPRRSSG